MLEDVRRHGVNINTNVSLAKKRLPNFKCAGVYTQSTENIQELFSINERVFVEIETDRGLVGVMFVAATNVGQIILSFDSEIVGNQFTKEKIEKSYSHKINKGDELGAFRMGSTVVMLYAQGVLPNENVGAFLGLQSMVNSSFC